MDDFPNWRNESVLYEYHVEKGWSAGRIAEEADVSEALVTDYLDNRDLLNTTPDSTSEQEMHSCPDCDKEFDSVDEWSDHHQSEHYSWDVYEFQRPE